MTHSKKIDDGGWHPIDSAPEGANGIAFMMLAYGPADDQSVGIGMRFHDQYFAAGAFYVGGPASGRQFAFREHEVRPTHWKPIPLAPQASDSAGASA